MYCSACHIIGAQSDGCRAVVIHPMQASQSAGFILTQPAACMCGEGKALAASWLRRDSSVTLHKWSRQKVTHLEEAADVEAHELPQDGQQQLVLAIDDVDAADVHQRQRQHPPRDAHHLPSHACCSATPL